LAGDCRFRSRLVYVLSDTYALEATVNKTERLTFRVEPGTTKRLATLAHLEALKTGRRITTASLLRDAIKRILTVADDGVAVLTKSASRMD
jgi:hypothetical protein